VANGSLPWISLLIALTFAFYGLCARPPTRARWKACRWKPC
jgi:EamA domain-containing membrane protein RarD